MPTRRQRQRRAKSLRHEYGFVDVDDEGNEVEVDMAQVRAEKKKPDRPKPAASRQGRAGRVVPAPSWNRALRRGGMFGGLMLVLAIFFLNGMSLAGRIALGAVYALAFIPLTYVIDRTAHRSYLKRSGKAPEPRAKS